MSRKIWILPVLFLTACTSLRRQADDQFEKGNYLAATSLYERALKEDPRDLEAKEGLIRARRHLIDARLLEVRQQRLADNPAGALDRLLWIVQREADWQVSPSGPAFSTQEEETSQLFRWFHAQARRELDQSRFLKAKLFASKYADLFAGATTGRRFATLAKSIQDSGVTDCRRLRTQAQAPFSREFARSYCVLWGVSESESKPVTPQSLGLPAFGQIDLAGHIENLPDDVLSTLSDSLLQALKTSPYYQADGPALKVQLRGQFSQSYNEWPRTVVHSYTERVPYQVTNTVPYQEMVPYTAYRTEYDTATHSFKQEAYTDYRSETRYREETETRYRDETRYLPYMVTEFTVKYAIAGSAGLTLDGVPFQLPLSDDYNVTSSYHDTHNPAIGLYARPKKMKSESTWLKERFAGSGDLMAERITQAWDSKYCQPPQSLQAAVQMEGVMKCLKGTRSTHAFVESWFTGRFGLSYGEVKRAMAGSSASGAQIAGVGLSL